MFGQRATTRTLEDHPAGVRLFTIIALVAAFTLLPITQAWAQGPTTVTLQEGLDDYAGTTDTYIDLGHPDYNWGMADRLRTKTTENADALVRFDLSGIPAGATVTQATLRLYAIDHTGFRPVQEAPRPLESQAALTRETPTFVNGIYFMPWITLRAHQVLTPWSEDLATWTEPLLGEAWGLPGAQLAGTDYHAEYADELVGFSGADNWAEFDVTELTQFWLDNPGSNYGAVIKAYLHYSTISYSFWSSEGALPWFRPQLVIEYE